MKPQPEPEPTDRTGTILTHHTNGRRIQVIAVTLTGDAIGRYARQGIGLKTYHGGQPIEMQAAHIDWETKTYNPPNGRTGSL